MTEAPKRICELVQTFEQHIEAYRSQQYNETQLRREFIDPFFEELGWDVTNKAGYAQSYKDVIHEDAIKIGGATKAPDYCFRIGGVRKFFLEAKKPSVDIKGDPHPSYQLRRYAWSARLPLSILTDFEELAVYDCQLRPKHTDKADVARIMLFGYKDYLKKWPDISDIFSKDAILKGSFDKFAAATKSKRGTSTVDKEFLAEIEKWRNMLARIIALRNAALSVREINFCVQRTIDRILFLRMCEDRGIERYGQLQSISSGERNYPRLCEVFEKADQKYNSGLFHFHDEPDRAEGPDELTPNIIIDDKDLKWILHSLYYPQSPYEFSVLPAEILGNVYEQFLGKVITLTSGHRASVEDKPEVKKAGGVYYTPSYIVDYIVKNTVGRLLGDTSVRHCEEAEGRRGNLKTLTPKHVSNIKILDPACGSGSFLIGAYQYLLDWHLKYYTQNDPEKYAKGRDPKIFETNSIRHCEERSDEAISNYRLTITEKKRILLNNIFGVDIDSQAVEVTKLSLLLKVLEGESSETLDNQYRFFHERALPDLGDNIKCGNSLIGPDFYDNLDPASITEELQQKINAFDWHAEFPEIFTRQNPGFDAVIGNPPYVTYSLGRARPKHDFKEIEYISKKYRESTQYKINSFAVFYEKGLALLRSRGFCAFIVPGTILINEGLSKIRLHLLTRGAVLRVVSLKYKVFAGAEMGDCAILFVCKAPLPEYDVDLIQYNSTNWEPPATPDKVSCQNILSLPQCRIFLNAHVYDFLRKVGKNANFKPLGAVARFYNGIKTGDNKKFLSDQRTSPKHVPVIRGRDFDRYVEPRPIAFVYFDPKQLWSNTNKTILGVKIKILIRQTGDKLVATIDQDGIFCMDTVHMIYEANVDRLFLLGLLNSHLLNCYHRFLVPETGKAFAEVKIANLKQLPVRTINLSDPSDKARHDGVVQLAHKMLDLHRQLAAAKVPDEKTRIQRQIDATDKQIDKLVYYLYGLTDEEIGIVEESNT